MGTTYHRPMDPAEFSNFETRYGPPQIRVFTFKLQQSLMTHIHHLAAKHKVSQSVIIRHALQQYFQKLNIDSLTP